MGELEKCAEKCTLCDRAIRALGGDGDRKIPHRCGGCYTCADRSIA